MTDEEDAYARGHTQGNMDAVLKEHSEHLAKINGSQEKIAQRLDLVDEGQQTIKLLVQRLADAQDADRASTLTIAAALEKARKDRSEASITHWSPLTRATAILGGIATLVGLVILIAKL